VDVVCYRRRSTGSASGVLGWFHEPSGSGNSPSLDLRIPKAAFASSSRRIRNPCREERAWSNLSSIEYCPPGKRGLCVSCKLAPRRLATAGNLTRDRGGSTPTVEVATGVSRSWQSQCACRGELSRIEWRRLYPKVTGLRGFDQRRSRIRLWKAGGRQTQWRQNLRIRKQLPGAARRGANRKLPGAGSAGRGGGRSQRLGLGRKSTYQKTEGRLPTTHGVSPEMDLEGRAHKRASRQTVGQRVESFRGRCFQAARIRI